MRERTDRMQYQAVFFDFDYTLGDGTEAIVAGFRYAFSKMGLPEPGYEAVRRTIGMTLEDEYPHLSGDADPQNRARFRVLYTEKAGPMQVETVRLYPGAEGGADDAVRALLAGALHYQPDYVCGHHKDEPPRVCGSHTCSAACYHETSEERSE